MAPAALELSSSDVSARDLTLTDSLPALARSGYVADPAQAALLLRQALTFAELAEQRLAAQAERIRELESLSITDPLTGLLNRRGFDDALERCLANAERYDERGLVAYIDLDGFKAVNDHLGHAAGDMVLRHVAELLRLSVRVTDYVARLGGDEFAILFTRVTPLATRPILSKLRDCFSNEMLQIGAHSIAVRASVGTASFDGETLGEDLLAAADRAMYREKARRVRHAA